MCVVFVVVVVGFWEFCCCCCFLGGNNITQNVHSKFFENAETNIGGCLFSKENLFSSSEKTDSLRHT